MTLATIDDVLADANLDAAWRETRKRSSFAIIDEYGSEVDGDVLFAAANRADHDPAPGAAAEHRHEYESTVLASALNIPASSVRELLADVVDLGYIGAGYGRCYRDLTAEPVRPIDIDGREVYGHCIRIRVLQRAFVRRAVPIVEKALPPSIFSYRPRRDRFAALLATRRRIRHGDFFVAKVDTEHFFRSVRIEQVWDALASLAPEFDESLLRLAAWFSTAPITRPGPRLDPALLALYQGAVVAPLLSNVVGAHIIDLPLQRCGPAGISTFRYGDDVLVVGPNASAVSHARDGIVELIESAGWRAHPAKTFENAVDVRETEILWLGKTVGVAGVSTPRAKITQRIDALVSLPRGDERVGTMAAALVNELFLDDRATVDTVVAEVRGHGPHYARIVENMVAHLAAKRRKRMTEYDAVLAPMFTA